MDDMSYATMGGYGQQVIATSDFQTVSGGYGGVSPAPMAMGSGAGPMQPPVPGAQYQSSFTNPETGGIVDRYIVKESSAVPVRQVVPEVQNFNITKQIMVPEIKEIQVPVQRMVPEEYTVMVPRTRTIMVPQQVTDQVPEQRTRMVPQTFTQTQQIQTQKAVTVQQPMQRTIQKVIEGEKVVEAAKIIEYERPRMIAGRYLGDAQLPAREVGLQWTKQYYQGTGEAHAVGQQVTIGQGSVQYSVPGQAQYVVAGGGLQNVSYGSSYGSYGVPQQRFVQTVQYGGSPTYGQVTSRGNFESDFEG